MRFSQAISAMPRTVRSEATEALSTLREVAAWPKDLSQIVPEANKRDHIGVFVHGFMATAGVFRPLRKRIENELQIKTASFSYAPGVSVLSIAKSIAELVSQLPVGAAVTLIGHSLGGIASRYYVQELVGHTRVCQTISLGSPFGGTTLAAPFPFLVGKDLGPQSMLLERLRRRSHETEVPHLSILGGRDRMVLPRESAAFNFGDVVSFDDLGHNGLLYDVRVHDAIAERFRAQTEAAL
jgi:triacylglycerol lipase